MRIHAIFANPILCFPLRLTSHLLPPQQDWSSISPLSSADGASSSSGGFTISNANARTGTQSIQVTDGGARQTVTLPPGAGHSGSTITFGGYSKAISTGTGLFNDYAILADVTLMLCPPEW